MRCTRSTRGPRIESEDRRGIFRGGIGFVFIEQRVVGFVLVADGLGDLSLEGDQLVYPRGKGREIIFLPGLDPHTDGRRTRFRDGFDQVDGDFDRPVAGTGDLADVDLLVGRQRFRPGGVQCRPHLIGCDPFVGHPGEGGELPSTAGRALGRHVGLLVPPHQGQGAVQVADLPVYVHHPFVMLWHGCISLFDPRYVARTVLTRI